MTQLPSILDSVTVYRRGALVTRSAAIPAEADGFPAEVRLTNLPLCLADGSLRFGVEGWGDLPVAVDARVALDEGDTEGDLEPAIDQALAEARLAAARARGTVESLRRELDRVRALGVAPRPEPEEGQPPPDSPTDARVALLDFRDAQANRTLDALTEAEEVLRLAVEALDEAKERRSRATSARQARANELRKTVTIRLEGGAPDAEARLVVRYVVPGAQWFPSYALRLDPALSEARLEARAAVRQATGEDWRGVELTLSTAAAQAWTELPELKALRIGRRQAPSRRSWRPPPAGTDDLYADRDAAFGPPIHRGPIGGSTTVEAVAAAEAEAEAEEELDDDAGWDLEMAKEVDDFGRADSAAADMAPPPQPTPAAPPAGTMQTMSAPRSSGLGGMLRSRARAGAAPKKRAKRDISREAPAPPEPPELVPDKRLLEYGALRMGSADELGRGRLAPADLRRSDAVSAALREADAVLLLPQPAGCRIPSSHGGFDFAVAATHGADVPADGTLHSIPVVHGAGPAAPSYLCVPGVTHDVFRHVELDSPLAAPLLAGPVDVYVGDGYLLTAPLRHTPGRGRIKLGLGVEQAIKVARNVRFDEEKAGLIGGSLALEHRVEVTLASHLAQPAAIEVRDRIPVPADEDDDDILVVVGDVEPPWEEWEPDERPLRGGRRWRVEVGPGEERTLSATFTVKIPKAHELVGGNRRDS